MLGARPILDSVTPSAGALRARHSLRPLISGGGMFLSKPRAKGAARSQRCVWKRHRRDTVDNSRNTDADIRPPHRYINPARHVRAFGVWIGIAKMTGSTRSSGG